jgi:hypothetical protein
MKRVFISQPMRGRTPDEIETERSRLLAMARAYLAESVEEIPSYFPDGANRDPVECLGESLKLLATAHFAVFAPGAHFARGCWIERRTCEDYGIPYLDIQTSDSRDNEQ